MQTLNAVANNANVPGSLASDKVRFGECGRFAVFAVHTRFDAVQWFVADAETPDELGLASIVRQADSFDAAVRGM